MKLPDVKKAVKKLSAVHKELHSELGKLQKTLNKRLSKIEKKVARLKR
jgi:hypothetical protein